VLGNNYRVLLSRRAGEVMEFKTLQEAIESIGYGLCSLCKAEHEFPDVKCDLMDGKEGK
jgi:hypothetical protein